MMMSPYQPEQLKREIIEVIAKHLGTVTAELYEEFYRDKPLDLVMISARELLTEVMGEKKATTELAALVAETAGEKQILP